MIPYQISPDNKQVTISLDDFIDLLDFKSGFIFDYDEREELESQIDKLESQIDKLKEIALNIK